MSIRLRLGVLLSIALSIAAPINAQQQQRQQRPNFDKIFDGETLKGWKGDPTRWSVENGAITGRTTADNPLKQNSFLIYQDEDLGNFVLRLRFRIENGNSGIQYRSQVTDKEKWVVGGYQADIDATGRYMGILYDERGRGILAERGERVTLTRSGDKLEKEIEKIGDKDELIKDLDPTEWHTYVIRAVGNRLSHQIDDRTMVRVLDRDREHRDAKGVLAFQIHTGPPMVVQFKDVELRRLPDRPRGQRQGARRQSDNAGDGESKQGDNVNAAGPDVTTLPGFTAERVYTVPREEQGSWVSLTVDPQGRLIASAQSGKLYRITLPKVAGDVEVSGARTDNGKVQVEEIPLDIGSAQGLCYAFDSLYVMVNSRPNQSGLYRVRDTNGDDQYDSVEMLRNIRGGGEHGPHAVIPGPDGKSLYICAGNHTDLPELHSSRVPQVWDEDHLLPRMWDARGHARGKLAPGGWVIKTDPDGKEFKLISNGYRNEYDIAFSPEGELFTYDADMEWDIGAPWYRPTRVCHVVSGSEFGWRSGTGKWPVYYPDNLPSVVDIGPGSPTGIVFGTGASFPEKYQKALYLCDWSYGIIYAVHLTPDGASYTGTTEQFAAAAPLPATDIIVNPHDGAMYFAVGGRGAQSALYRVTFRRLLNEDDETYLSNSEQLRKLRRSLEAKQHGEDNATEFAWPHLAHTDRFIRYAARIAIEQQPVEEWRERVIKEEQPLAIINSAIALARHGDKDDLPDIAEALGRVDFDELGESQRLELLRAYGLSLSRLGPPDEQTRQKILNGLNGHYPADGSFANWELARILVYLNAPDVAGRTLTLLERAPTQQAQIHYAFCLRALKDGWTIGERAQYLDWFHKATSTRGGMSFDGFLRNIRSEAIASMTDLERTKLAEHIDNLPQRQEPTAELESRELVRKWTVDDLASDVAGMQSGRNFLRGREIFASAQCFKCHRVQGEGDTIGPDLTGVGRRFNAHDLLTSVIEPNIVISDQYQQTTFVVDGRTITGRIVNLHGNGMNVMTDMLDQSKLENVRRDRIEEQFPSTVSAMPAGLLDTFTREEVLDLMAYLIAGGDAGHSLFR